MMNRQGFSRRVIFPIVLVTGTMVLSIQAYDVSRQIKDPTLHQILSNIGAIFMFLSIWTGAFFANTIAFFRGATFKERLMVCLTTPIIWCAKILYGFWGIYSPGEFLYLFLHHFILGCPTVALLCMGISEIWCRMIAKRRTNDRSIRIFALNNTLLLLLSLTAVFLMLWNGGHAYYYLYMDTYAGIFL